MMVINCWGKRHFKIQTNSPQLTVLFTLILITAWGQRGIKIPMLKPARIFIHYTWYRRSEVHYTGGRDVTK
jgi:hypothetical protein